MLIDWNEEDSLFALCPLCRVDGDKPHRLAVRDRAVDGVSYSLYGCPAWGGAFFDPPPQARY